MIVISTCKLILKYLSANESYEEKVKVEIISAITLKIGNYKVKNNHE